MELYKVIKNLFIVAIIAISIMLVFPLVTKNAEQFTTDSGFDASYDGGGSSGSSSSGGYSSSGSSHDSSSGGSDFDAEPDPITLTWGLISTVCYLGVVIAILTVYNKNLEKEDYKIFIYFFLCFIPILQIYFLIKSWVIVAKYRNRPNQYIQNACTFTGADYNIELSKYGLTTNIMLQQAFSIYKKVQIAWMNGDVDPVRNVLSDEIYNMYKTQLLTLTAKHQKNMMEEITYKGGFIKSVMEQKDDVSVIVHLVVSCKDYIIDTNTDKVVRGDKYHLWTYDYDITYTFNKNSNKVISNCPGCNAKLPVEGKSIKCEYCGTTIKRESTNMVMTKKTMVFQR